MGEIDPSIPLAIKFPAWKDAGQVAKDAAAIKESTQRSQGMQLENQQRETAIDREKAISNAMRSAYGGDDSTSQPGGSNFTGPINRLGAVPQPATGSAPPAPPSGDTPFVGPRQDESPAPPAPEGGPQAGSAPPVAGAVPSSAPDVPPAAPAPTSSGMPSFDKAKFAQSLIRSGHGAAVPGVLEGLTKQEKATAEVQKLKQEIDEKWKDASARSAFGARVTGADGVTHWDPDKLLGVAYHDAIEMNSQTAMKMVELLHSTTDPQQRQQLADNIGKRLESGASAATVTAWSRAQQADTGGKRLALETPKIEAETANAQTTGEEKKTQNAAAQLAAATTADQYRRVYRGLPVAIAEKFDAPDTFDPKTTPDRARQIGMTPAQQNTARHEKVIEAQGAKHLELSWSEFQEHVRHNKQIEEGTSLSPEAVEKAADMMATTGTLPPLGMGAAAAQMRSKILDRAAKKYADVDWASAGAQFKADQGSLGAMQKQRDAVGAFEDTALKNVKVFEDAAKKVIDTGSPFLNKPLRAIDQKVLGSGEQAAFNTARLTVIPEFAKILNNPNLGGQLSDSARHEIDTILAPDATLKQIYDSIAVLKKDTANRRTSYDEAIANIQKRITQKTSGKTETAPTVKAGDIKYLADGSKVEVVSVDKDGKATVKKVQD